MTAVRNSMRDANVSTSALNMGTVARFPPDAVLGSGMLQWVASDRPANPGQASRTLSHSVTMKSKCWSSNSVRDFGRRSLMSMPREASTLIALGWMGFGWLPPLTTSTRSPARCCSNASAIWERAPLPVQAKRTPAGGDQAAGAKPAEMVRHERLRLADQGCELVYVMVAACQLGEQTPTNGVADQTEEGRCVTVGGVRHRGPG